MFVTIIDHKTLWRSCLALSIMQDAYEFLKSHGYLDLFNHS